MMKLALLLFVLLLAGCTQVSQNGFTQNTAGISNNISNISENITQSLTNIPVENSTINANETNSSANTETNQSGNSDNIQAIQTDNVNNPAPATNMATYDYSGNPLDLFKTNTVVIFGDGGPLVAATINLEAYIGTTQYIFDDKGLFPEKNVILLGNCTNSYIAKLTSCDGLNDGTAYLKLFRQNNYAVLIIYANRPADVFNAVNIMIKPDFTMRSEIQT